MTVTVGGDAEVGDVVAIITQSHLIRFPFAFARGGRKGPEQAGRAQGTESRRHATQRVLDRTAFAGTFS